MKLPGLIDIHVHLREPGGVHKEDWDTGTAAALAGGFTTVLAMPNTNPPLVDDSTLDRVLAVAGRKARCDFGVYWGAGSENADMAARSADRVVGLKMYLDQTYGPLQLDDMQIWAGHFEKWPKHKPVAVHAEARSLAAVLFMASLYDRPIHVCHVSKREEILMIRKAKGRGIPVTCEVCPHHLFLTRADMDRIGPGRAEVRPRLALQKDQDALWDNLDVIDVFATDHAPHTLNEKDGTSPPPGFPGLETALPLLLTAVHEGRLTYDDLVSRMHTRPVQIFGLESSPDTYIEIDPYAKWEIRGENLFSKSAWTPFEGVKARGRVRRVVIRGTEVFNDGNVSAPPGFGRNVVYN